MREIKQKILKFGKGQKEKSLKNVVFSRLFMAEGVKRKTTLFESSTFHTSAQTRRDKPHRSYRHSEALRQARFK